MTNFIFLQTEWPAIHQAARRVEEYLQSDPRSACFHARRALELTVQWLFTHDPRFNMLLDAWNRRQAPKGDEFAIEVSDWDGVDIDEFDIEIE